MKSILRFIFTFLILYSFSSFSGCGGGKSGANDPFLSSNGPTLSITVTGMGKGKITSNGGGIDCTKKGGTCQNNFKPEVSVILKAEAEPGYLFLGWYDGACRGNSSTCELNMKEAKQVKGAFAEVLFTSRNKQNRNLNIWIMKTDGSEKQAITALKNAGNYEPQWSPDGETILYLSNRDPDSSKDALNPLGYSYWIVEFDSQMHTYLNLIPNNSNIFAHWSPDGKKILFRSTLYDIRTKSSENFFQLKNAMVFESEWSPNGQLILYFSNRAFDGSDKVEGAGFSFFPWIFDLTSKTNNLIETDYDYDLDSRSDRPLWSIDSKKIAYLSSGYDLKLYDIEKKSTEFVTQLTKPYVSGFQWSPDGTKIAYISNRSLSGALDQEEKNSNLWLFNLADLSQTPMTQIKDENVNSHFADNQNQIQWSPDSKKIVYSSKRVLDPNHPTNYTSNIWMIDLEQKTDLPITSLTKAGSWDPQWSPDGMKINYFSIRALDKSNQFTLSNNLWVFNLADQSHLPLTQNEMLDYGRNFSWSPDSSRLSVMRYGWYDPSQLAILNLENGNFTPLSYSYMDNFPAAWLNNQNIFYISTQGIDGEVQYGPSNFWISDLQNPLSFRALSRFAGSTPVKINYFSFNSFKKKVAYSSNRNLNGKEDEVQNNSNIWTLDFNSGKHEPITQLTQASSFFPNWSLQGTKMLYTSNRSLNPKDDTNIETTNNIWVYDPTQIGNEHILLTQRNRPTNENLPKDFKWFPNEEDLAFLSPFPNPKDPNPNTKLDGYNLWKIDVKTATAIPLTKYKKANIEYYFISNNGKKIIYISNHSLDPNKDEKTNDGSYNLWILSLENNPPVPKLLLQTNLISPAFYCENFLINDNLVCGLYSGNNRSIFIINPIQNSVDLIPELNGHTLTSLSPDGQKLLCKKDYKDYLFNFSDKTSKQISSYNSFSNIRWMDETFLFYLINGGENTSIWRVQSDGQATKELTDKDSYNEF